MRQVEEIISPNILSRFFEQLFCSILVEFLLANGQLKKNFYCHILFWHILWCNESFAKLYIWLLFITLFCVKTFWWNWRPLEWRKLFSNFRVAFLHLIANLPIFKSIILISSQNSRFHDELENFESGFHCCCCRLRFCERSAAKEKRIQHGCRMQGKKKILGGSKFKVNF